MFSNPLPDNGDYRVVTSPYAQRHYIKRFAKDYKGKRWEVTMSSIEQDLRRLHALQLTQQVDELWRGSGCLLFKYDFTVAQSGVSPKSSGNRCVVFLDMTTSVLTIVLLYGKTDLPKKTSETQYITAVMKEEYASLWKRLGVS